MLTVNDEPSLTIVFKKQSYKKTIVFEMIAKRIEKRLTTLISGNINNTKKEDHILQMPGLGEFGSVLFLETFIF